MNRLGLMPLFDMIDTGDTPPRNINHIWYDTNMNTLKKWNQELELWEPLQPKDTL